jgi:hypothetical protein
VSVGGGTFDLNITWFCCTVYEDGHIYNPLQIRSLVFRNR